MALKLLRMLLRKKLGILGAAAFAGLLHVSKAGTEESKYCGVFGDLSILVQGTTVRLDRQSNCPMRVGTGLSLLDADGSMVGRMRVYCQAFGYAQATVTFVDQGRRVFGPLKVVREARSWSAEEPTGIGRVTAYDGGFTPEGSDTWCRSVGNVEIGRKVSQRSLFGPSSRTPFTPPPGQCPGWFSMEGDHPSNGENHLCPGYMNFPQNWSAEYQQDDFTPWFPEKPARDFIPMPYNGRQPLDLESDESYLDARSFNTYGGNEKKPVTPPAGE